MQPFIMITNGGAHSAEEWAEATASQIIQIAKGANGEYVSGARKLEIKILDVLEQHHTLVQIGEREKLTKLGSKHLLAHLNPEHHCTLDEIVAEIVACADGTQYADHFAKPNVQAAMRHTIGSHFSTSMSIERSLHADGNSNDAEVAEFRAIQSAIVEGT